MTIPLKAALFDFGGTLDSDGKPWLERFLRIYEEEGLRCPREELARAFYRSDDGLPARFDLAGLGLERTVRLQVGCVIEVVAPGQDDLAERVSRRFVADSRRALARNRPVLERLRERLKLGVVSNFYGNLDSVLTQEGLLDLFDAVADSGRVGSEKPAPEIFRHALRGLGAEPREAFMVGDSIARDMRGAEALGMPHAWLAGDRPPLESCCPAATALKNLAELESALWTPA